MANPPKKRRAEENYEKYWHVTLAYTDIDGEKFLGTLKIIKKFIDENEEALQGEYSSELYNELQGEVKKFNDIMPTSIRKSINQFVKLGFVNSAGRDYHPDLEEFLSTKLASRRKTIFSKIVYESSSFQSSWDFGKRCIKRSGSGCDDRLYKKKKVSTKEFQEGHVKFLVKTLSKIKKLCKEDILGLMFVDIEKIPNGYLSRTGLNKFVNKTEKRQTMDRKYNQLSHFRSILARLDGLKFEKYYPHGECLHSKDYADELFPDKWLRQGRDPYLQNRYRGLLEQESREKLKAIRCMVTGELQPHIASHIKPFTRCDNEQEAYDGMNGLLLIKKIDKHFDKGRISFSNNGKIILSKKLSREQRKELKSLSINKAFLNKKRLAYLDFHRRCVMGRC